MSWETWLAFCLTETFLCLTPGPAVLFVVSIALARGTRPGLAATLGILAGNTFYFVLSALGVAAVVVASPAVFMALKWAGAAYLIWLGLRMLVAKPIAVTIESKPAHDAFVRGFVVQTANPKTLLFFTALLPQFLDTNAEIATQVAILAVSSVVIELAVLALYVLAAVKTRQLAAARIATPLERIGGAVLVAAGARLAYVGVS
jgi:threonine/homoserine/homoserine lactone efflux protein